MAVPPPSDGAPAYDRVLALARQRAFAIGRAAITALEQAFTDAVDALSVDEADGAITPERADALRTQLHTLLDTLSGQVASIADRAVSQTITDTVGLHAATAKLLAARANMPATVKAAVTERLVVTFTQVPVRAVAAVLEARGVVTGGVPVLRTLVNRHVAPAQPALDRVLASSVARGVSAPRLTAEIQTLLRGETVPTPAAEPGAAPAPVVAPADAAAIRTLKSDARRIAVSEINNAHREASRVSLDRGGVVGAVKWQLSGRHHGSYDACDTLAASDFYGLGAGWYPPASVPRAPHPYCGCTTGAVRMRPVNEWGTPSPAAPALKLHPSSMQIEAPAGRTAKPLTPASIAAHRKAVESALRHPPAPSSSEQAA